MKHANFYLTVLSLSVIGLSGYTLFNWYSPQQAPSVLGESDPQISVAPANPQTCKVGVINLAYGSTCEPGNPVGPSPTMVPGQTSQSAEFYNDASYECADGSKGNVVKKVGNNDRPKCLNANALKAMAGKACKERSSCATKNYIPCAELEPFLSIIKCPSFLPTSASASCNTISQMAQKYCPDFVPTPKPTKVPKATNTPRPSTSPKPQSCRRDPKTFSVIRDNTCAKNTYRQASYTCFADSVKKTLGTATSECKKSSDLRIEAASACSSRGTCASGQICGDDRTCKIMTNN